MSRLEKVATGQASDLEKIKQPEEFVRRLGRRLFETVFRGGFQPRGMLALELQDPHLHYLPWEFLHDGTDYLVSKYGIIRLIKGKRQAFQPVPADKRLNILVAMASPLLNYDPDVVPEDRWTITEDVSKLVERPQPTILDLRRGVRYFQQLDGQNFPADFVLKRRTSKDVLRRELSSKAYDVLHFSGHGHKGLLSLEDAHAIEDLIDTNWLKGNLQNLSLKLAVFSSCWTAAFEDDFDESIAGTFLQLGVPVVIAMRLPITVKRGELFTRNFYQYLTDGLSVPEALRLTRQVIWDSNRDFNLPMWEFGVPVLFLDQDLINEPLMLYQGGNIQKVAIHIEGARMPLEREELFVGRREELVRTAKLLDLEEGRDKVALIHGSGGIGKTALALEAGHRFSEGFDRAIFASARRESPVGQLEREVKGAQARYRAQDTAAFLTQIAREVGLAPEEFPQNSLYAINDAIVGELEKSQKRWLLILDNLEELTTPEDGQHRLDENVLDLITRLPNDTCRIILTTRYQFSNLPGLFLDIPLSELKTDESAELMTRYHQEKRMPVTQDQLQTLFQKTRGHPLTMRLLLAQLATGRSFKDIMVEIQNPGKIPLFEYAFQKAVEYAGADGKRLFAILSLFDPDTSRDELEQVSGEVVPRFGDAFAKLLSLSLIETVDLQPLFGRRYSILQVMRDWGRKLLDQDAKGVELKSRFANLVLKQIRAGYWNPATHLLHRSRQIREWGMLHQAGETFYRLSGWDEAFQCWQAGLTLASAEKNRYVQAAYLGNMGLVYQAKGEWDKALEFYEKDLKISEQVGDIHGMALTLGNVGFLRMAQKRFEEAVEPLEQAIAIFKQIGDKRNLQKHQMALERARAGGEMDIAELLKDPERLLQMLEGAEGISAKEKRKLKKILDELLQKM